MPYLLTTLNHSAKPFLLRVCEHVKGATLLGFILCAFSFFLMSWCFVWFLIMSYIRLMMSPSALERLTKELFSDRWSRCKRESGICTITRFCLILLREEIKKQCNNVVVMRSCSPDIGWWSCLHYKKHWFLSSKAVCLSKTPKKRIPQPVQHVCFYPVRCEWRHR